MIKSILRSLAFAVVFFAASAGAVEAISPESRFISQLSIKNGHLSWQGARLGQSQSDIEKLLGTKLALRATPRSGLGVMTYSHEAIVLRDGLRVRLGFAKQGSQSYLQVVEPESLAPPKDQIGSLRKEAKAQLKGLRDSGPGLPLTFKGGEELDISEYALRLQAASDAE